ncbi:hypothetical protein PENTCL1PPCAC_11906, partial [Pristionchus entomophagus]
HSRINRRMLIPTVVNLMLLVTTVLGTVVGTGFQPMSTEAEEGPEEDKKVSECFGKLRIACTLNTEFSLEMDRLTRTLRVDRLRELIEKKVEAICTEDETDVTVPLLREELSQSARMVKEIVHNLSDFDRDRLNMWANLNDTLSERNFFMEKIKNLAPNDMERLTECMNSLMARVVNGDPPQYINEILAHITPEEKQVLSNRHTSQTSFDSIVNVLLEKTREHEEDLRQFLSGTWRTSFEMSVLSE